MRKIVLICGMIAGLIPGLWCMFSMRFLIARIDTNTLLFYSYIAIVLGFSFIYVGVKNFKENQNSGVISFNRALKLSLLIAILGLTVYIGIWSIDFYIFKPIYVNNYASNGAVTLKTFGVDQTLINDTVKADRIFSQKYYDQLYQIVYNYKGILPVVIIISFIVSSTSKRNSKKHIVNA